MGRKERLHERVAVRVPITLLDRTGIRVSGMTLNVSASGALVEMDVLYDAQPPLYFHFRLPGAGGGDVIGKASLRWRERTAEGFERYGIEFLDMEPDSIVRLDQFVEARRELQAPAESKEGRAGGAPTYQVMRRRVGGGYELARGYTPSLDRARSWAAAKRRQEPEFRFVIMDEAGNLVEGDIEPRAEQALGEQEEAL
ncbi:MAG TPA: PilZ domain-containing protein [Candidatus Polarisedimenticolia bacterium]|nr:PilZ domain-containing protein [Candidatus Polarisedimenticolia bacterium]